MILSSTTERLSARLVTLFRTGGVAILPCDTIYGFVGRVPDTEERIRRIKGRGETNPFLMLVGSVVQVNRLAAEPLDERLSSLWPAPLTIVVRTRGSTVAVRLPDDPFLRGVLDALDAPVYSTSVNRSDTAPLWRIADIVREFEAEVDLIVDDGDRPGGRPSTILDATARPFRILRQGAFEVPPGLLEP